MDTKTCPGCSEDVPDVECGWVLPEPATERVPSRSGFNLRVQVRGIYTAEELPAVRFFSDREGDNPDYPNGLLLETGIAWAPSKQVLDNDIHGAAEHVAKHFVSWLPGVV